MYGGRQDKGRRTEKNEHCQSGGTGRKTDGARTVWPERDYLPESRKTGSWKRISSETDLIRED